MKADSIHGSIGKKMRKKPEIVTFQDFVDLNNEAGTNIKAVVMEIGDLYSTLAFLARSRWAFALTQISQESPLCCSV